MWKESDPYPSLIQQGLSIPLYIIKQNMGYGLVRLKLWYGLGLGLVLRPD